MRVQAWESLNNPDHCGHMNTDQFYRTMLQAGYSQEVAQEAAKKLGWDRLEAGLSI